MRTVARRSTLTSRYLWIKWVNRRVRWARDISDMGSRHGGGANRGGFALDIRHKISCVGLSGERIIERLGAR